MDGWQKRGDGEKEERRKESERATHVEWYRNEMIA